MEFCEQRLGSALLFKQRLGKTYIAAGLIERTRPQCTLLIVPLTNKTSTWQTKLQELIPHVPTYTPPRQKRKSLVAALEAFQNGIFLVSVESFCALIDIIRKMPWDLIVVDESQRCKDRASLFSRCLSKLRKCFARKVILTGTPADDDLRDLWAPLRFASYTLFGDRWKDFEDEYLDVPKIDLSKYRYKSLRWRKALLQMQIAKRKAKIRKDKMAQFLRKAATICWREELPGPEPVFHIVPVTMYGYQRQVYDILNQKGRVHLDGGGRILPELDMVKKTKLRQITSGFVYDDEGEVHDVGRAKLRALKDLLKKLPKPVPIFSLYVPEIAQCLEELPGKVDVLWGKTAPKDRATVQENFQAGKLDNLLCQTRTGGVGIDLYRAKHLIVLSSNYSYIDFDQLISRIRLPGKEVHIWIIIVTGTIDEERQVRIFQKDRRVNSVLRQLKRK